MGAPVSEPLVSVNDEPRAHAAVIGPLARTLALALVYVVSGRLGLELAHEQDNATLFWPPTGIALAAAVTLGRRTWPAIAAAAFVVNLLVGTPIAPALGIAVGNTLEAIVGASLLVRFGFRPTFDALRHVLALLGVALAAAVVSTLVGVGSLHTVGLVSDAQLPSVALTWWLGNLGGAMVVAPLVLLASRDPARWRELAGRAESWLVLGATLTSALVAFGGFLPSTWSLLAVFLPFPFLVWSGLTLGPRGAVVNAAVVAVVAVLGTAKGHGPFAVDDADVRLLMLWAYAITMGTTASILAAAIAERDRSEAERRASEHAQHALEVRMRDKQRLEGLGLLASGVAHDFNNILAAIRVNTDLLVGYVQRPGVGLLADVDHAVSRATELCRQLLAYAGRSPTPLGPVDLASIVDDVRRLVTPTLAKDIALTIDLADELPWVEGEASQLRQVLLNLVLNANDAIGEREGRVRIAATADGELVRLEVEDDGAGMDEATRARIFDPFFTTKATGRGLGLAAVAGIVKAHGGTLSVASELGRGTTFTLTFRAADRPVVEAPAPSVTRAESRGLRVLVADDEAPIRHVVQLALELAGHEVVAVGDGVAAVEEARASEFDVVLLDLTMPGRGGVTALESIRTHRPTVGAVLMSGYDESQLPHDEVFLPKPFSIDALVAAVNEAAHRARAA